MHRRTFTAIGVAAGLCAAALLGPSTTAQAATSCSEHVPDDINGDGYQDTVIADPSATVDGHHGAGAVQVRYGGPKAPAPKRLTQANTGGVPENNDHFGAAVTIGQVDGDSCADIIIGAPGENLSGKADAGVVHVVFGAPKGAGKGAASLVLHPGASHVPSSATAKAHFGAAVAVAGEKEGGGHTVAIGAPGVGSNAGAVWVLTVSKNSSVAEGHLISQATKGVPGTKHAGNRFGSALGFGFLAKGSRSGYRADLLVGAPGQNNGAGAAILIKDAGARAPFEGITFSQATGGVDDSPEPGDGFGSAIDVRQFSFTGETYVAVGVPGEDLAGHPNAGLVHVFHAAPTMAQGEEESISQNTKGMSDAAESGDRFGAAVRVLYYATGGGTGFGVAVGAPGEDVGAVKDAGGVAFFSLLTASPGDSDGWVTQNSPGVPGAAQGGDHFGAAVGASPLDGLLVGVPDDAAHATGAVQHLPWPVVLGQGTKGAKTWALSGGARFGAVIG